MFGSREWLKYQLLRRGNRERLADLQSMRVEPGIRGHQGVDFDAIAPGDDGGGVARFDGVALCGGSRGELAAGTRGIRFPGWSSGWRSWPGGLRQVGDDGRRAGLAGVAPGKAQFVQFLTQTLVFLGDLLPFALHGLGDGAERYGSRQLLFASQDACADGFRVLRAGTELEVMIVMINGRGRIGVLLIEKPAEFEVSGSGFRVYLKSAFERLDGSLVIQSVDAAFAGQKMGLLLLIELALARGQAAAEQKAT